MTPDAGIWSRPPGPERRALAATLAFRWWCLFSFAFLSPVLVFETFPHPALMAGETAFNRLWAALGHAVGVDGPIAVVPSGSGDMIVHWIQLVTLAAMAAVAAAAWTIRTGPRGDRAARVALRGFLRHGLGFIMLGYGVIKVFAAQFPPPSPERLQVAYGESSPMSLLWTFMGASPGYQIFTGVLETVGALLLLSRRTATAGAAMTAVLLVNVVALNLCYDVAVKINSTYYLLACAWLLWPALGPLVAALRTPGAADARPRWRWSRRAAVVLGVGAVIVTLRPWHDPTASMHPWITHGWVVETFTRDGVEVPPRLDEASRWRRLRVFAYDGQLGLYWRTMDDRRGQVYLGHYQPASPPQTPMPAGRLELTAGERALSLEVALIDDEHLWLSGWIDGHLVVVTARRFDPRRTVLMSHGIHAVSESSHAL